VILFLPVNRSVYFAILAEKSVGKAIASSNALVCRLGSPKAAADASIQVRATLLKGSCSVKLQPLVWQCVLKANDLASVGFVSLI
jgi:hypothetical protein